MTGELLQTDFDEPHPHAEAMCNFFGTLSSCLTDLDLVVNEDHMYFHHLQELHQLASLARLKFKVFPDQAYLNLHAKLEIQSSGCCTLLTASMQISAYSVPS